MYYGDGNSKHDKALILTSEEHCKTKHHYTYCIINNDVDGVRLTGTITSGFVSPYLIHTAKYKIDQLKFIENVGTELLDEVLNKVKKIFTMSINDSVPLYHIHKP